MTAVADVQATITAIRREVCALHAELMQQTRCPVLHRR